MRLHGDWQDALEEAHQPAIGCPCQPAPKHLQTPFINLARCTASVVSSSRPSKHIGSQASGGARPNRASPCYGSRADRPMPRRRHCGAR
jgi:hypothetical protein